MGGDRRDLAVAAIREAARVQLLEQGLARFTAEAVARRAGCSRATLYRLTGGKKALLAHVLIDGATAITTRVAEGVQGLTGAERVIRAMALGLGEIRQDPALHGWVRNATVQGVFADSADDLGGFVTTWIGEDQLAAQERNWIVRVFLQLLVWPGGSEAEERELLRRFVGPVVASHQTEGSADPVTDASSVPSAGRQTAPPQVVHPENERREGV